MPGAGGGMPGAGRIPGAGGVPGAGGIPGAGSVPGAARVRPRRRELRGALSFDTPSDLEQFGFLVLEHVVDLRDIPMGQVVELLLGAVHLVLTRLAILGQSVEGVLRVPPHVTDGDSGVLRLVAGYPD